MKKLITATAVVLLTVFASCKKEDDNSGIISTTIVSNTVISGNWRVTYYWDTDHDATSNFSGYGFTFTSGGIITAVKGSSTVSGTWSTGTDDSKVKLNVAFASPSLFQKLTEDWHVTERTDTRIKMEHISGGNGGTDYLTIERN